MLRRDLLAGEFVIGKLRPSDAEALNESFLSLMAAGNGTACARRAVEAIAHMAAGLHRAALEYKRDNQHIAFFYMIGRRFKRAKGPMPSAGQAIAAYDAMVSAVRAECPKVQFKDYAPKDHGSAVRRAMKRGAGGASLVRK